MTEQKTLNREWVSVDVAEDGRILQVISGDVELHFAENRPADDAPAHRITPDIYNLTKKSTIWLRAARAEALVVIS